MANEEKIENGKSDEELEKEIMESAEAKNEEEVKDDTENMEEAKKSDDKKAKAEKHEEEYEDEDEEEDTDESKKSKKEEFPHKDEDEEDEEETDENKKAKTKKEDIEVDVSADVSALVDGEELSEEFKTKAATIFEAAVKSKIAGIRKQIREESKKENDERIESMQTEMTENVDNYLNYTVKEWMTENKLAVETGVRNEVTESFISGLKKLFEEHYIDVPDEKYDVLEAQSDKISELEDKLNEQIEKNVNLKESNDVYMREQVIAEVSDDLADTEVEKFKSLTEDVDFTDEESFREKLETLKESYFPKVAVDNKSHDENDDPAQDIDTTGAMSAYMSAISRNKARAS